MEEYMGMNVHAVSRTGADLRERAEAQRLPSQDQGLREMSRRDFASAIPAAAKSASK